MRRVNAIDQIAKYIGLLGEFGVGPVVILVMILQDEHDAALGGMGNACLDRFGGISDALFPADLRPAVP